MRPARLQPESRIGGQIPEVAESPTISRLARSIFSDMRSIAPVLLPIFRSEKQAAILTRLFLSEGGLSVSDLARALSFPIPTTHREVDRLEKSGLLVSEAHGRNRVVAANRAHPAHAHLLGLLTVVFGPPTIIAEEFRHLDAFEVGIFGSWADRHLGGDGPFPGDVDVLVVGEYSTRSDVYAAADAAQQRLGVAVNPVIRTPLECSTASRDALVADILESPYVPVLRTGESIAEVGSRGAVVSRS